VPFSGESRSKGREEKKKRGAYPFEKDEKAPFYINPWKKGGGGLGGKGEKKKRGGFGKEGEKRAPYLAFLRRGRGRFHPQEPFFCPPRGKKSAVGRAAGESFPAKRKTQRSFPQEKRSRRKTVGKGKEGPAKLDWERSIIGEGKPTPSGKGRYPVFNGKKAAPKNGLRFSEGYVDRGQGGKRTLVRWKEGTEERTVAGFGKGRW